MGHDEFLEPSQDSRFELKESGNRGAGVLTKSPFKRGEVVMRGAIDEILNVNHKHASQIGENEFITPVGFMALVNHSCAPNCGIKVNETGAHDYVAMVDISPGEEITIDYAMQNYEIGYFPSKCLCGAVECRGEVGGWKDLPADRRIKYKGFIAPYLLEMDLRKADR